MRPSDAVLLAEIRAHAKSGEARRIRQDAGLSLTELALVCGDVAPSTISRWERGVQVPRNAAGLKYARIIERLRRVANSHTERAS